MAQEIAATATRMAWLEKIVNFSAVPLCTDDIWDKPDSRVHFSQKDKVAQLLSAFYKAKRLGRVPYTKPGTNIRYAYTKRNGDEDVRDATKTVVEKPTISIREAGSVVVIDLPRLRISIETK